MKSKSDVEWTAIADMMSGLMVIFLLLALTFISRAQEQYKGFVSVKKELYQVLILEFESDLEKWNAELDEETLTLRFKEPDILFKNGSSEPNIMFRQILNNFFPRYARILSDKKFQHYIEEIKIEGHTSSKGVAGSQDINENYRYNLKLSQERAREVLWLSLNSFDRDRDWEIRRWLRGKLTANGLSFSRLIYRSVNGKNIEDEARSRRVEFRVEMNTDDLINSFKLAGVKK